MTRVWYSILVLCWLSCVGVYSEDSAVLHLKNGDRVTGRIVAETLSSITVGTTWSGKVDIPRAQVQRIERRMIAVSGSPTPIAIPAAQPRSTTPVSAAARSRPKRPIVIPVPAPPNPVTPRVTPTVAKPVVTVPAKPIATMILLTKADPKTPQTPSSVAATPVAAKPVAAKPVAAKPVAAKPVAAKPVASKPVAAKPVASKPVASKPVAAKPVAAKPVASKPVASKPVASKPVASKPVAATPVAAKPVAAKASVKKVAKAAKKPAASGAKKPAASKAPVKPKKKGKWTHDIRLGLDLRYNSVDAQTVHSRIRSSYTRGKLRNLKDLSFAYGESGTVVSANKFSGSMKTDVSFDPGWYLYHAGSAGYDQVRRISLQYAIGPGVGYHLIKGKKLLFKDSKFSMDVETGGEFQERRSLTGAKTQKYFLRLGQEASWVITKDLKLTEEFDFYPRIGELPSHRYRVEGNLAYRLVKNLSLNLTFLAQADPETLADIEPDDVQVRSSLGWKF